MSTLGYVVIVIFYAYLHSIKSQMEQMHSLIIELEEELVNKKRPEEYLDCFGISLLENE